jgi:hypothetical protein
MDADAGEGRRWLWLIGARASRIIALELWDFESWHALAARQVQVARDMGALVQLQFALIAAQLYISARTVSSHLDRIQGSSRPSSATLPRRRPSTACCRCGSHWSGRTAATARSRCA